MLDAADALVREERFHTATMDDLAERSGVSRATIFSRFGSKLGVLETLSSRCSGGPEIAAVYAALAKDDPVEALDALVGACCDLWEFQGHILLQLRAIVALEPEATQAIAAQEREQRQAVAELVGRLAAAGLLRADVATAAAALHVITSLEAFARLRRSYGLELPQVVSTLTELGRSLLVPGDGEPAPAAVASAASPT